jgi:triacylglycerol lipase
MAFPFDPGARGFSLTNALGSALAAELAYADPGTADTTLKTEWGFKTTFHYAAPPGDLFPAHGFLAVSDELALVAFRGTDPAQIKDWLTDASAILVPSDVGRVHAGFVEAFRSIWPALLADLRATQWRGARPLWFTGHSLGAALATLAVASCHDAGVVVAGHYNFGSPRVGDSSFVIPYDERYAAVTSRFVNNNDLVTRVPPRELAYRHVDARRYFDRHCRLVIDPHAIDLLLDSFSGSILGLRKLFEEVADLQEKKLPLPDFLEDHRIASYIACLRDNV